MGWSRALAAVVACGVLAAGVAGCTGDDPGTGPSPSPSVTTSTSVPSTPAPTAAPVAPVLPAAAKKPTEAGARAFIAYYWALINYAQVTGDVKDLEKVSGLTCGGCQRVIEAVRNVYAPGGHATGGQYEVTVRRVKVLRSDDRSLKGMEVAFNARNAEQVIVRNDGTTETSAPKTSAFLCYLLWARDSWRADVLEPR